jgi:hypothetical protein
MATYRIHRLKNHLRHSFRHAPHVSGAANVKARDYVPPVNAHGEVILGAVVEAPTPYAAYFALRGTETPLEPGDLLESETGDLRIFKFVGFEEARWVVPDPKPETGQPESETSVAV